MIEISTELKNQLKQQRLDQYRAQIFSLQMDLAAYEAIGEQTMIDQTKKSIESGEKAYAAVEAME